MMENEISETKKAQGYHSISLPDGIYDEIRKKIEGSNGNFTSVADFVKYVIRKELEVST